MKKIISVLALAAFCTFSAKAQYSNETIKVGQVAPELSFNTPEGKALSLKTVGKGQYVLLDFWASWCGPCRASNPAVVATYNKYKSMKFKNAKGFTIFSVSLDKNKDAWMAAIKKDGLVWPYHVSDLGGWQSEPATIYGIQYIPQAFLIGPDGKVIGKYNDAREAAADLAKYAVK